MDQDHRIACTRLEIIGLYAIGVRGRADLRILASCHAPLHPGEHTCRIVRVALYAIVRSWSLVAPGRRVSRGNRSAHTLSPGNSRSAAPDGSPSDTEPR